MTEVIEKTAEEIMAQRKADAERAIEVAKSVLTEATAELMKLRPRITTEQLSAVVGVRQKVNITEAEQKSTKAILESVRLSEEDKDQINAAKMAARIEANRMKEAFIADIRNGSIREAKRKLRPDGRTMTTLKVLV